jgi:predicted GNAT superfamily acetyltransferase
MSISIRDVREHELDSVLALNNAAGVTILPLDATKARFFYDNATYFRVAEVDGHIAGFLVAFDQDAPYQSSNYLWFRERYPSFLYIDRVVVASSRRGAGLGRVFYADVQSFAEVRAPLLACEVFLEPRNDVAVLFHGTYGFQEVGQQVMPETGRRVSLLAKELSSYAWVRDTYLAAPDGALPDEPWLTPRLVATRSTQLATGT